MAVASTNALNVDPAWNPLESPYFARDDVVEERLAGVLVAAHRSRLRDRPHLAGARLDHRQRADGLVLLVDVRPAPTASAASWKRRSIVVWIVEAAGVDQPLALVLVVTQRRVLLEVGEHVVAEERRGASSRSRCWAGCGSSRRLWSLTLSAFLLGDDAQLGHPVEHHVATLERALGVVGRVERRGVLHEAGQDRGLVEVELARR